jgi:hypothetical protein
MDNPGRRGKAVGMARAARAANPAWTRAAMRAVLRTALTTREFSTDEVMAAIDPKVRTHELRALGPVMSNAMRDHWIAKAARLPVSCRRASRHMAPLTVWRSLIYRRLKS